MTLDPHPGDAELLRRASATSRGNAVSVNGVALGPNSPLRPRSVSTKQKAPASGSVLTPKGQPRRLLLVLPEPPSLNVMIDLAKKRTRRTRVGGWMRRSLPVVYDQAKERYERECQAVALTLGIHPPVTPWNRWRLDRADFRLHQLRDSLELLAGLKWTVDWLVHEAFVVDDGPAHLLFIPMPGQRIERADRGITIEISEACA